MAGVREWQKHKWNEGTMEEEMRNIYLGSLFKFDGGICGKLYFKKCILQHFKTVFSNSLEILSI